MKIFLDFDGVLHCRDVDRVGRQPQLRGAGKLFEHAGHLADALATRKDVQIVLSTSWVPHLGFDRAKSFLPAELQHCVIGATYHRHAGLLKRDWLSLSRNRQISAYVSRHGLIHWLAIDDLHNGDEIDQWPAADRHRLIHTNSTRGLSDPQTAAALREVLEASR